MTNTQWLNRLAMLGLRMGFLMRNLGRDNKNIMVERLVIQNEWKRLFDIVNVKTWRLIVACPMDNLRNQEVKESDLTYRKVSKDLAKDRNTWNTFTRNCPIHANMKMKHDEE